METRVPRVAYKSKAIVEDGHASLHPHAALSRHKGSQSKMKTPCHQISRERTDTCAQEKQEDSHASTVYG
uniref:Uncharacterized protein n=1 Tax=Arundo donax TaxID=35708 RepID=A0A0A9A378_ARUDO